MRKPLFAIRYSLLAHGHRASRRAFTLIELVIVIAIIAASSIVTLLMFYGRRNADDLAGAKEQVAAVLREAQSRSMSEDNNAPWGVHFANTTSTAPSYALFSTAYSTGTTAAYYRLPSSVGMILVPSGLVGYWPFDEKSGTTAYDFSGNGNNATLYNSAAWSAGRLGYALSLANGGSTNNALANASGGFGNPSTITLAAWVYPTAYSSGEMTVIEGQSPNGYYLSVNTDGSVNCYWYGASPQGYFSSGAGTVPLNQWAAIACVWNGTSINMFTNGVSQYTTPVTTGSGAVPTIINIGAETTARQFVGKIDDVRIYNRALSATEISQLYSESADVLFSKLVGTASASTSVELYSLGQFGLSSTISIAPDGEVSY
jgi:prepilin-type N-terminal cleavage/methylation domain-containing protein